MSSCPRHRYTSHIEVRVASTGQRELVRLAACSICGWKATAVVAGLPERMAQYDVHKITTDHQHTLT